MKAKRRSRLQRSAWTAAAALLLLVALYVYVTRPAKLRAGVLRALAELPVKTVGVGHVSFSLRNGLELSSIDLSTASRGSAFAPETGEGAGTRLHVAYARIHCDVLALLRGRLRARDILLDGVDVAVTRPAAPAHRKPPPDDEAKGAGYWTLLARLAPDPPTVRLDQADVRLLVAEPNGPRLLRRWLVSGSGAPGSGGYQVRLERWGPAEGTLLELLWNQSQARIEATADWLELETLVWFLPGAWADLSLRGRGRMEQAVFAAAEPPAGSKGRGKAPMQLESAELRLVDVRCSLPIEDDPEVAGADVFPPSQRFLQVSGAALTVSFERDASGGGLATIQGAGKLNGAPALLGVVAKPTAMADPFSGLDGVVSAELRVEGLSFPTVQGQRAFVTSRRLPRAIRYFFNDFRPRGKFNLHVRAGRSASAAGTVAPGGLQVEGEVEPLGTACRYRHFPYDFREARGRVRFSPAGIVLEGLHAQHGSNQIWVEGVVDEPSHTTGFALEFVGTNMALDGDLYAALPPRYQRLWEQAAPLGVCDAEVTVRREAAPEGAAKLPPTDVRVDARLLGGSLLVEGGRRLRDVHGSLSIGQDVVAIHDLHGELAGATVRLAGTIGVDRAERVTDVGVEAAGVPVQRVATIAAAPGEEAAEISFAGRGDVWGHLHGAGRQDGHEAHYTVQIKDGRLTGFDPNGVWEQCQGWISVSADRQQIHRFSARQADSQLEVSGTLPASSDRSRPVSLDLHIADAPLDALTQQLVPPQWRPEVDALGLTGSGVLRLQLRPSRPGDAAEQQAAEIHLSAERMRPTPLPIGLEGVQAHATISAAGLEVHGAQGRLGEEGQVRLDYGRMAWKEGKRAAELGVSARDVEISPELIDAMPEALSHLLKRLEPTGRVGVNFDRVRLTEEGGDTWEFSGGIKLKSAGLQLGLPLTEADGQIAGTCAVLPDGATEVEATVSVGRGRLAGRAIEDWEGTLRRQPGDRWVRLEDLRGRLCGGDALGFVRVDPKTAEYELSLTLQDVDFNEFLPPRQPGSGSARHGRLDGHVFLRGTGHEAPSRNGGGELRIRGASFLQTPVLAKVTEASRQADEPFSETLDLAELRFVWQGSELKFTRVDIESRDLRMVGEGTWNMDSDAIALTLVGAHPRHWPRIAVLTDVLETTGQELVQYHVDGTAAAPDVTVEPLYKLNETLRALLSGGE